MKKRGKRIKHHVAVMPLGVKRKGYELGAHIALEAVRLGIQTADHLVSLWVLADICQKLPHEPYITAHSETMKRLIESAYESGAASNLEYISIEASANILLEFFESQKNTDIAKVCLDAMKQ